MLAFIEEKKYLHNQQPSISQRWPPSQAELMGKKGFSQGGEQQPKDHSDRTCQWDNRVTIMPLFGRDRSHSSRKWT